MANTFAIRATNLSTRITGFIRRFDFGVTSTSLGSSGEFRALSGTDRVLQAGEAVAGVGQQFAAGIGRAVFGQRSSAERTILFGRRGFIARISDQRRRAAAAGAGVHRSDIIRATCVLISVPVGGNMLVHREFRGALSFADPKGASAAWFFMTAATFTAISVSDSSADDYTNSVGVGVRYETPVGPVRFDVGYRITPIAGVRATQYFVTLGQSF